jgi:large subunit ribosomal protein L13
MAVAQSNIESRRRIKTASEKAKHWRWFAFDEGVPAPCAPEGSRWEYFCVKNAVDLAGFFDSFAVLCSEIEMKTYLPKINVDERKWHVIDANGAVLGRLAAQIADTLRGKNKPIYTPHLDAGDFVVVINAEKVVVTGKKETDKKFMTYSGWKGGEKYTSVEQVRARTPEKLITHAVRGMVPKNRLGRVLMTKLKVYKGGKHPHEAQQPQTLAPVK